jgi:hypothetical protein
MKTSENNGTPHILEIIGLLLAGWLIIQLGLSIT